MNILRTLLAVTVIGFTSGCCTMKQKPTSCPTGKTSACSSCEKCQKCATCKNCCS